MLVKVQPVQRKLPCTATAPPTVPARLLSKDTPVIVRLLPSCRGRQPGRQGGWVSAAWL